MSKSLKKIALQNAEQLKTTYTKKQLRNLHAEKNNIIFAILLNLPINDILNAMGLKIMDKYRVVETSPGHYHIRRRILLFFSFKIADGFTSESEALDTLLNFINFEKYLVNEL